MRSLQKGVAIIGAGIGGLATASALGRLGVPITVFERTPMLAEVGAGLQLGPNATRILSRWGLDAALSPWICTPQALEVRDAQTGGCLAALPLGSSIETRYGYPYWTIHRAHLHQVLHEAALGQGARIEWGTTVQDLHSPHAPRLQLQIQSGASTSPSSQITPTSQTASAASTSMAPAASLETRTIHSVMDAVIACDGVHSRIRECVMHGQPPTPSGHIAWRALLPSELIPPSLDAQVVTLWLGPGFHVVTYGIDAGRQLNIVWIGTNPLHSPEHQRSHDAQKTSSSNPQCKLASPLVALVQAVQSHANPSSNTPSNTHLDLGQGFLPWILYKQTPLLFENQTIRGHVALLGDAAHAMHPYLAQGATMALEDAHMLAHCWSGANRTSRSLPSFSIGSTLHAYARLREPRANLVQKRAWHLAHIFHAQGPLAFVRNTALRWGGSRLLDQGWLYKEKI
jgi:salicylate hydroxylase